MSGPWIKANWKWSNKRWQGWTLNIGISEVKWTGMGEFNSDDHYIYYCRQESLRRNGVAIMVNKSLKCSTWMQSQKRQMISVRFQGKPFSITVIQVYAPTSKAEEAEVERWSWTILWRLIRPFRTNTQKRCPFHYRGLECKNRKSRKTLSNKFGLQISSWNTE